MKHKEVEVYIDNMMVKLEMREGHFEALDKLLARIEKYNLRLNMKKYIFRVTSGKLLGHEVSQRGTKVDPDKVKAIQEMPILRTEKEVRRFLGNYNASAGLWQSLLLFVILSLNSRGRISL